MLNSWNPSLMDARHGCARLIQQTEQAGICSVMRELLLRITRLAADFLPMRITTFLLLLVYLLTLLLLTCNFVSEKLH